MEFRLRVRQRFSAFQSVLLLFLNIVVLVPLLVVGIVTDSRQPMPVWLRAGAYLLGMSIVLVELAELMRPGIVGRLKRTCAVGADGVQGLERFVPWPRVRRVVPLVDVDVDDDVDDKGQVAKDRPYGARDTHGVVIHVDHDDPLIVWVKNPKDFVAAAERFQKAHAARRGASPAAVRGDGYRDHTMTADRLVRVVLDTDMARSRRADAFSQLNPEERDEALEQLAEAELLEELA